MSQQIKTGYLRYYHRGLLSRKWKEYFFILLDDSTLQWFEKEQDRKPEGMIRIRDVARNMCVGTYTRCLANRPELPRPTDEANLIALPRGSIGHHDQEIIWILCNDVTHLNDWMKAIVYTLPPPSQQQPAPPPFNARQPYPTPNLYPRPPPPQRQPMYSNQQPSYNNTTVVVQPSPTYGGSGGNRGYHQSGLGTNIATAGLGFAGGTLFGGALGYAWEHGVGGGHSGWRYGMGPAGFNGGFGGPNVENDTTVINNYYNNETTNNYDSTTTNNQSSTYDQTNNYSDDQQQQGNGFQNQANNEQGTENTDGGQVDYGNGSTDYGGDSSGDQNYSGDDSGYPDYNGNNSGGNNSVDYNDAGGGSDFGGGGDFGGGDW